MTYSSSGDAPQFTLSDVLHFGEDDLALNRQGRLSETQQARLQARLPGMLIMALLVASFPLTFVVVSILTLWSSGQFSNPADNGLLAVVIVILLAATVIGILPLVLMLPRWRAARRDLALGAIHAVEGMIDYEPAGRRRSHLIVYDGEGGEARFLTSEQVATAFAEGVRYRVYYTPHLRRVVAAELIEH